jgi:5'-methylthioadenosine phosphorylase
MPPVVGVIGGSGLYDIDGLENIEEKQVATPFGEPSDSFVCGTLNGVETIFLARHGRSHSMLPSELNHYANIYALKKLGATRLLSIAAVGSLREQMAPRDIVLVDQFFDRTRRDPLSQTFFGNGIVGHVSFAEPVCPYLLKKMHESAENCLVGEPVGCAGRPPQVHLGGTYVNMEGPAFSTRAESNLYRSWNFDVIGMTSLAEAKLAREAEICFATMAMVTDYDCWHDTHGSVTVEMVVDCLNNNSRVAKKILCDIIPKLNDQSKCGCRNALENSVMTAPAMFPKQTRQDLAFLLEKYFPQRKH